MLTVPRRETPPASPGAPTAGMFGLELGRLFPRSTFVTLEPNRSLWMAHSGLAREQQQPNLLCLLNPLSEEVLEALSHSNEFVDAQVALACAIAPRVLRLHALALSAACLTAACAVAPYRQVI